MMAEELKIYISPANAELGSPVRRTNHSDRDEIGGEWEQFVRQIKPFVPVWSISQVLVVTSTVSE